ncbi:MAG: peptidylprolyl isomerase, partial [Planctomycetota bacterium]
AAHIQTTDAVLESLFLTKYTEIFQSGDQLAGKNTSLVRYALDKEEVALLLYSQEKHQEILPDFIKEKMALLEKVRQDILDQKITFVQAVGQYSEDLIENVKSGGNIGLVDAYGWPQEFSEQVQKLNTGEISPPFHTDQGLFLVQVDEMVPNIMITARHLLFTPPTQSENETSENTQTPEEMIQKPMEEAQEAWKIIQNSPNPQETFLEMIRTKKLENDGLFGPIARNQIYKSYLKTFEEGKLGEIQPPFPTMQGVYIIQPIKVADGRKCRQLVIPTQYTQRFNQFLRKEANSQIEAKMKEILDYLKSHNLEETANTYAGWIKIENLDYYKKQMEPAFEEQLPSMKKGDISKPFWSKDLYLAYQVVDIQQISYQEAKPQLLRELLEAKEEPTVRTGPALAKLYPYQFTFYFPYQNKKLEAE